MTATQSSPILDIDAMTVTLGDDDVAIDWFEVDSMNHASVLHLTDGRVLTDTGSGWAFASA